MSPAPRPPDRFRRPPGWSEAAPPAHVCWHRVVAEIGPYLYYACSCGSRTSGTRVYRTHERIDQEWLNGADRAPKEVRDEQ